MIRRCMDANLMARTELIKELKVREGFFYHADKVFDLPQITTQHHFLWNVLTKFDFGNADDADFLQFQH